MSNLIIDEAAFRTGDAEEDRRRLGAHKALLALLLLTEEQLRQTVTKLASAGETGLDEWFREAYSTLLGSRTTAWKIGREYAGDDSGDDSQDEMLAESAMHDDALALTGFQNSMASGDSRYITDDGELKAEAVATRLVTYALGVITTAVEAAVLTYHSLNARKKLTWDWILEDGVVHCEDCPALADLGPYSLDTLPCYPGDGTTKCGGRCLCRLQASDGWISFAFLREAVEA